MLTSLKSCRTFTPRNNYSVYFLKGTDPRPLNIRQQQEISEFVKNSPKSTSFLVYNST